MVFLLSIPGSHSQQDPCFLGHFKQWEVDTRSSSTACFTPPMRSENKCIKTSRLSSVLFLKLMFQDWEPSGQGSGLHCAVRSVRRWWQESHSSWEASVSPMFGGSQRLSPFSLGEGKARRQSSSSLTLTLLWCLQVRGGAAAGKHGVEGAAAPSLEVL